jgi:hypothetical protein
VNIESPGSFFAVSSAGNFNGDVDSVTGNAVNDIVVGQQLLSSVTVFAGNENWTTSSSVTIDMASEVDMDAHALLNIQATSGTLPNFGLGDDFGERCAPAGDILPTPNGGAAGMDDILVNSPDGADSAIWVIPGREITTYNQTVSITGNTTDPVGEDALVVQLRQNVANNAVNVITQYGKGLHGGDDLTGDGVADVLVGHSGNQIKDIDTNASANGRAIHVFDGATLSDAGGTFVRPGAGDDAIGLGYAGPNGSVLYSNPQNFAGGIRPIGNWDGWIYNGLQTQDLAFVTADKELEVRMNHATSGGPEALGVFPVKMAMFNYFG